MIPCNVLRNSLISFEQFLPTVVCEEKSIVQPKCEIHFVGYYIYFKTSYYNRSSKSTIVNLRSAIYFTAALTPMLVFLLRASHDALVECSSPTSLHTSRPFHVTHYNVSRNSNAYSNHNKIQHLNKYIPKDIYITLPSTGYNVCILTSDQLLDTTTAVCLMDFAPTPDTFCLYS